MAPSVRDIFIISTAAVEAMKRQRLPLAAYCGQLFLPGVPGK
jgi:hypothetical protein